MRARHSQNDKGGVIDKASERNEFGALFKASDSGLLIQSVGADTAAADAGIQVDDKVISFDGWQVNADNFPRLLNAKQCGDVANIHIFRSGRLLRLKLPIRSAPLDTASIAITDTNLFETWIGLNEASN